jgi:hypothetical protein
MYNSNSDEKLISVDIVEIMHEKCSVQMDIGEDRIKASALIAQDLDLGSVMTDDQISRSRDPDGEKDNALRDLVIPAWCFYTYARCIALNIGSFTESGYVVDKDAKDMEILEKTEKSIVSIAHRYLDKVNEFLKENGYKMNASGGEIKGTPTQMLEQSSILADKISIEFLEVTKETLISSSGISLPSFSKILLKYSDVAILDVPISIGCPIS